MGGARRARANPRACLTVTTPTNTPTDTATYTSRTSSRTSTRPRRKPRSPGSERWRAAAPSCATPPPTRWFHHGFGFVLRRYVSGGSRHPRHARRARARPRARGEVRQRRQHHRRGRTALRTAWASSRTTCTSKASLRVGPRPRAPGVFQTLRGRIAECRWAHASGTTTAGALIRFGAVEQAIAAVGTRTTS